MRITPACAGKSSEKNLCFSSKKDHPRVCGEKDRRKSTVICLRGSHRVCGEKPMAGDARGVCGGSPPRVRGKAALATPEAVPAGITPACAGKSTPVEQAVPAWEDHPRVCGEKQMPIVKSSFELGSPPRVRGKVALITILSSRLRITPACAGKRIL